MLTCHIIIILVERTLLQITYVRMYVSLFYSTHVLAHAMKLSDSKFVYCGQMNLFVIADVQAHAHKHNDKK